MFFPCVIIGHVCLLCACLHCLNLFCRSGVVLSVMEYLAVVSYLKFITLFQMLEPMSGLWIWILIL